jgi:hypothetical protein
MILGYKHLSVAALTTFAVISAPLSSQAGNSCQPITAASLEIGVIDCAQALPQLQASGQFPDVFAGSGKAFGLCYAATGPASAMIGNTPVTVVSSLSAWTTDFVPALFGGPDNLGTVVTELTISGFHGGSQAKLYTRDTIDLSQILSGRAPEEDVIVGGTAYFNNAKGTYRIESQPEDPLASKVLLNNLNGTLCGI